MYRRIGVPVPPDPGRDWRGSAYVLSFHVAQELIQYTLTSDAFCRVLQELRPIFGRSFCDV
jgi:hypothetical protein